MGSCVRRNDTEGYAQSKRALARSKSVAECATPRALHDRLIAGKRDIAIARSGNIVVCLADQQRAKLGLAKGVKELGEAAMDDIELQRLLVVEDHYIDRYAVVDLAHSGVI